jgi:hypothetical protein
LFEGYAVANARTLTARCEASKGCYVVVASSSWFCCCGLPLGIVIAGQPLDRYLSSTAHPLRPTRRSPDLRPCVFIVVSVALCRPYGYALLQPDVSRHPYGTSFSHQLIKNRFKFHERRQTSHAFPWWGWLGAALTALSWALAWNRFSWFEPLQPFTFTPLWLGYILLVNAWTFRRTGHCVMLDRPRYFLWLFPLSSAFWWFFEYLNRFVQNWYYIGAQEFTPLEYFLHATLPFSTVLPAVLVDGCWHLPRISAGLEQFY